jgi:cardiolipin synthase A/B
LDQILSYWQWVVSGVALLVTFAATGHVVLYKRDSRSAIAWVGIIWLAPVFGALLYYFFGINRIQRRARRLRRGLASAPTPGSAAVVGLPDEPLPAEAKHLAPLARLVGAVTGQRLLVGNRVQPLPDGDIAYPAMLDAIAEAQRSVTLATYIFDNDAAGKLFADALGQAVARNVAVRVLVDEIGIGYAWPATLRRLRRAGVRVARFLPKLLPWIFPYANLRNHRKLLVVDGRLGFTGGMNVTADHYPALHPRYPIQDVHFQIEGPVVARLQECFADDWEFCTDEALEGEPWFAELGPCGPVVARGIASGPDDDLEKLRLAFLGALSCARTSVRIVTPYFLPDYGLVSALNTAALRGVQVEILLPQQTDNPIVQWAVTAQLWQVLDHGCKVWLIPPPFDHTKLILVDGVWTLLGSANWDPRSLRLNFEFDVECYDEVLTGTLEAIFLEKQKRSRPVTLADVDGRSLPIKLRDGVARLLTPYL